MVEKSHFFVQVCKGTRVWLRLKHIGRQSLICECFSNQQGRSKQGQMQLTATTFLIDRLQRSQQTVDTMTSGSEAGCRARIPGLESHLCYIIAAWI